MQRVNDKYGRGSAAANGAEFVDLEPGDTFSGLEAKLRSMKDRVFENAKLGLSASVGSMRNANELAKHLGKDEDEESHKFAAKNVGALFARASVGIRHLDKKAVPNARWVVTYVRVFSWFAFAGERKLATITLKENKGLDNFYSVEALEINKDTDSERTPRGAISEDLNSAPFQNLASQLANRIAYYVGDVNRTKPAFLSRSEAFNIETAAKLILNTVMHQPLTTNHQPPTTNITVIILTGNEELHIGRCLERLRDLNPRQVLVVESQNGDRTHEIAVTSGAKTVFHAYPGNQAEQFNWALDNLMIGASWILRIDADEYLTDELTEEIKQKLPTLPVDVDGVILKRRHYFAGGWAKHGTYPVRILRLFRNGKGRYAPNQMMDERIEVPGKVIEFENDFIDHSLISMDDWRMKHRDYAKREAKQFLAGEFHDPRKVAYYKLPRYMRAVMYFGVRYFLKGGFLDGKAGWMWNFWQGLWYRCLVDREISKLQHAVKSSVK